tara:strand:- start:169 stop:489 length:321 start_codon:yes stop_codon:yes gene_type:complete
MHLIIIAMLLIIFLYEVLVPKIVKEGNTNPPNDCNRQQENTAIKQQTEIDDLNGKLSRFEQRLKQAKQQIGFGGFQIWANEQGYEKVKKELAKSKAEVKNPKKETA